MSTDDTFKLLKLDKAEDKLLSNPNLRKWAVFVEKKTGNSPEETMVTKLRAHYGDAPLATILKAGGNNWLTREMAVKLQNAQFKQWYNEGMSPYHILWDVFKVGTGNKGKTPAGSVWYAYSTYLGTNKLKVGS
ncbi:RxLR effector protein [Phytophthora megakarya]|uniref:RxLR effector protein n=1 Tax=Phytophthora megakarya TaxID=4795 RepID=A0A225VHX5_9STRA|nr:RxLR effector protein [Phytophthora megakarya]